VIVLRQSAQIHRKSELPARLLRRSAIPAFNQGSDPDPIAIGDFVMRTAIIATSFLLALAAPLAAMAEPASCGVPQGYGTSNPHTFNRSTCGFGNGSYSGVATPSSGVGGGQPQGFGTSNPYIPNSGSPHLGSATAS
jgi:hypothetical protein